MDKKVYCKDCKVDHTDRICEFKVGGGIWTNEAKCMPTVVKKLYYDPIYGKEIRSEETYDGLCKEKNKNFDCKDFKPLSKLRHLWFYIFLLFAGISFIILFTILFIILIKNNVGG